MRKKFVIKSSSIPDDPVLPYEKSIQMVRTFGKTDFDVPGRTCLRNTRLTVGAPNLQNLRRAPHIVRPLLWADDIITDAPDGGGMQQFCQEMDDRKDMIYLEYMKGGSLSGLIGKVVAKGAVIPNGVLWKVFFCRKHQNACLRLDTADSLILTLQSVVRACLAIEYPPRLQIQENGYWMWDSETGDDGVEKVPDQEYQRDGYGLVHFDLDPDNGEGAHLIGGSSSGDAL